MSQCTIHFYAPFGIERQAFLHEIDRQGIRVREELGERLLFPEGQGPDVFPRARGIDGVKVVQRWCAQYVENQG